MDKDTLRQLLTDALKTQPFTLPADRLASPAVATLFQAFLPEGRLVLSEAAIRSSADPSETVVGGVVAGELLGARGLRAEARFSVAGGTAHVRIDLTGLPADWKPSTSFPSLKDGLTDGFTYAEPILTLDSRNPDGLPRDFQKEYGLPANSAALESKVARGLSLRAKVTPVASNVVANYLLKHVSFPVTCPIEPAGATVRLRMSARSTVPFEIAGFSFPVAFDYIVSLLEIPGKSAPASTSLARFGATLRKDIGGRELAIPISARCDVANPSMLVFTSRLQSGGVPIALKDIPALLVGASIAGQIPADFPPAANLALLGLEITVDTASGTPKLLAIAATVGYADPEASWSPVADLVVFKGLKIVFRHIPGRAGVATTVSGTAEIAGGRLQGEIDLPSKSYRVRLGKGETIDVGRILNAVVANSVTMPAVLCTGFEVIGDSTARTYRLKGAVRSAWGFNLGGSSFVLNGIGFDVARDNATGTSTGQMIGTFTIAGTSLQVRGDYKGGAGWVFRGGTPGAVAVPVTRLIAAAGSYLGLTLPSAVPDITLSALDIRLESATGRFFLSCGGTVKILGADARIGLLMSNTDDRGNRATIFSGHIAIGSSDFTIDFMKGAADRRMTATWAGARPLDFSRVASYFGVDLSGVPRELIPQVTSASFTYDFTAKSLVLTAATGSTKTLLVMSTAEDGVTRIYGALLGVGVKVGLSDLPLVGRQLPVAQDMGVDGLQVLLASSAFTADRMKDLNTMIPSSPDGLPTFPEEAVEKGVTLSIPFHFGGKKQTPVTVRYGGAKPAPRVLRDMGPSGTVHGGRPDVSPSGPGGGGTMHAARAERGISTWAVETGVTAFVTDSAAGETVAPFADAPFADAPFADPVVPETAIEQESAAMLAVDPEVIATTRVVQGTGLHAAEPNAESSGPTVKWLKVERSFGPVSVKRVGVSYHDGKVWLLIDAGFTVAALTIELLGLSLGFSLEIPPALSPALSGLGISYRGGPVQITGAFQDVPNRDGTHRYDGLATIKAASFTLSAVGSYGTVNGDASMFVFAMLNAPLGGPSFFFVTGIAAGFGFNRSLVVPSLDDLPRFPLVAAATATSPGANPFAGKSDDPGAALAVMGDYIPPSYGSNWLAAGVRFTSFEMIQSFALLTVTFGTSFEVMLLGLSRITIPTNAPNPIGFAELAYQAVFSPDKGVLAISGKLTPRSYILSEKCRLTGGFAFYTWLTENNIDGAPAGDFVISLGGYHPAFRRPEHYPQVPRVAANWQVSDNLSVKGSLYFAITPNAVMAGGSLEAVWQSGDLKAWFNAQVDFLLSWKPFYYAATIGISLGASYRVNLLFTSFTATVRLGVTLNMWGPSFAGTAEVDLYVVSFTISFGNSNPNRGPISWDDFKKSFLPKPKSQPSRLAFAHPTAAANDDGIRTDTYCYVRVSNGLVRDLTKETTPGPDWVVNPETFQLVTHSVFPCTGASLVTGNGNAAQPATRTTPQTGAWSNVGFGVGAVGIPTGNLVSNHVITIHKMKAGRKPDTSFDFSAHAVVTPSLGNAPKAAWSGAPAPRNVNDINGASPVIEGALHGFVIDPLVRTPAHTVQIDIAKLLTTQAPIQPSFAWARLAIPVTDTFDQSKAMQTLTSTINAPGVATTRSAMLAGLRASGLDVSQNVEVSRMAASASAVLLAEPILSRLGEEKEPA